MDFLDFVNEFKLSYSKTLNKYETLYDRREYTISTEDIITFMLTEEEINKMLGINTK